MEVYKAAFQISAGRYGSDEIVQAAVKEHEKVIELAKGYQLKQHRDANATYAATLVTSDEIIKAEAKIFKAIEEGKGKAQAIIDKEYQNDKLTESQNKAINHILCGQDKISAIVGWAGVGKTTFVGEMQKELSTINEMAKESGYKIIAISNTNTAVNELKTAGIENGYTVAKFLHSPSIYRNIDDKTIVIVDESSFLSTKDLANVIEKASGANKVVLIGDDRQLPGVQAGSPFAALVRGQYINHIIMSDIIRQRNEELRSAVKDMYGKRIEDALEKITVEEIGKDTNLAMIYHAMLKDQRSNYSMGDFYEVKKAIESINQNPIITNEPKTFFMEQEIAKSVGADFEKAERKAFFFYKDLMERLKDKEISEPVAREILNQMFRHGWIVTGTQTIKGKEYGYYQTTSLFGVDFKKIEDKLHKQWDRYQEWLKEQYKEMVKRNGSGSSKGPT